MQTPPSQPIVPYRHALSGPCHRVELFNRLLGLPPTLVDVDQRQGRQRAAAFVKRNRSAQVPVIEDGSTVADSNAILTYLALRYAPEHGLARDTGAAVKDAHALLDDYPALRAWLARVEALPGFVAMPATACGLRAA